VIEENLGKCQPRKVFSNPRMSLKGKGAGGEEGSFRK
jgi:hypothetical protein